MTEDAKAKPAKAESKPTTHSVEGTAVASVNEPVSPEPKEPKQTSAKSAGAKPATRKIAPGQVVGSGETDPIKYSSAKPSWQRKVLTVLHVQRALAELGFSEASSSPGGTYDALTRSAVSKYQASLGEAETGVLTRDQFAALFEGDPNVDVAMDSHEDHAV